MVHCEHERLVLQSPSYGFRPGIYPADERHLHNQGQKEGLNEHSAPVQRTNTVIKKNSVVRKKKQMQGTNISSASEGAHSTYYAQTGNNPARSSGINDPQGDIILGLDDLQLLFLII